MIAELAERLGMDTHTLVDLILSVAGDHAQMTVGVQSYPVDDGALVTRQNTGYLVMIASGHHSKFTYSRAPSQDHDETCYSLLDSVTISLR